MGQKSKEKKVTEITMLQELDAKYSYNHHSIKSPKNRIQIFLFLVHLEGPHLLKPLCHTRFLNFPVLHPLIPEVS